jgi:tetratricopeptide (TPR) repeat protein
MHTYIRACMHAFIHTYIHMRVLPPYIHTYAYTAVKAAAAAASRDAGLAKESARLLEQASLLQPAWHGQSAQAIDCAARQELAKDSDFYWTHFLYSQCMEHVLPPGSGADPTQLQMQALAAATKLKPDWAVAYNDMGLRFGYWQARGQLDKSVTFLEHAARLDPSSGIYATNLGMAYQHVGRLAKAAEVSRRAALLLPDNSAVQEQLGRALEDIEDHKVDILNRLLSLNTAMTNDYQTDC